MRKGAAAMTSSPAAEEGDEEMEDDVMAENWKVMRGQSAHESPTPGVIYFRPRKFVWKQENHHLCSVFIQILPNFLDY